MADDTLLDAAGRIADGGQVDWAAITSSLPSERDRATADELAVVAQIAAGHRQLHQLLPVATDTPPSLMPDRARWGHLDLLNVVGRGSYGVVYRAWDTRLERLVALKLFHGASNPDEVMHEGRMLARVRHENVVTVFGADVIDGTAGIWMELVHGKTLDNIVKGDGVMTAREAAAVGVDVARALAAVHGAGLLHCDVKAQNVVRENTGRVVLMDLGAGRVTSEHHDGDQLSDVAGTPRYMAPELFHAGTIATKACDMYSFGVLLYFLVSGRFPVDGKTLGELKKAHAANHVRPLASVCPGLPGPFLALVSKATDRDPSRRPESAADLQALLAPVATGVSPGTTRRSTRWWVAIGAGAVVTVAVLAGLLRPEPGVPIPAANTLAVLPIRNLTGDPAKQYLADGMTEVLTAHLARLPGLQVASSATTSTIRALGDDERAIAEKLTVRLVLAGAVVQAGERIAISVRLVDPRAGQTIWGRELDRRTDTILSARSEIASLLAARLSLEAPGAAAGDVSQPLRAEAQDAYLRGLAELASPAVARYAAAADLFSRAVALEPAWADPAAYLAFAQQQVIEFGNPAARQSGADAVRSNALRAIQLDPLQPMSYTALAAVQAYHDWDFSAAEASLRQGLDAAPRNGVTRGRLALLLAASGRLQEAVAEAERARDLEPLVPERHTTLGIIRYYARDFDGALAEMRRALAVAPDYSPAVFGIGRILTAVGRYDEAIDHLRVVSDKSPSADNPSWLAHLAMAYALAGRQGDVDAVVARLRRLEAAGTFVSIDNFAYIAGNRRHLDEAFTLLDEAVNRRMTNVLWLAVDPRADSLRADPRFDRVIARMGLVGK